MNKKIIKILLLIIIAIIFPKVDAMEYRINELIPVDTEATIQTEHFKYSDMHLVISENEKYANLDFSSIQNISDETVPLSITVAFFDENRKNISIHYHCMSDLKPNEEIKYAISALDKAIPSGQSLKDIKYIAILDENISCKAGFNFDNKGKTIEEINSKIFNFSLSEGTKKVIKLISVMLTVVILLVIYNFAFLGKNKETNMKKIREEAIKQHEENLANNQVAETQSVREELNTIMNNNQEETPKQEIQQPQPVQTSQVQQDNNMNQNNDLMNMYK